MVKLIRTIILSAIITIGAMAQTNQIEGKFVYSPNFENIFNDTNGYGGGIELTTNLGGYIKLLQRFDLIKSREGSSFQNFNQRDISFQSTIRLYPTESYRSLKPFVQGGIRSKNTRYTSSALIKLPGDPGTVNTENKFTHTSPFIGAGINVKDFFIGEYNYYLPDFTSKVDSGLHRERGHYARLKAFIPLSRKFSFNPAYEVFRRQYEFGPYYYDQSLSFGLAYRFDNEATVDVSAKPRSTNE